MTRLSLTLLGDFQARFGPSAPLRLRTRKTQALLAYLARAPGQPHSRDKLAALLWGDRSPSQARGRLRETLFALRRALGLADPPCLDCRGEVVALKADTVDVDVLSFERLVQAGSPHTLEEAVRLYRGDFLEGLAFRGGPFEDWLMAEREELRELALEALAKLLAHQRASGSVEAALSTALRLIALDPLQEPVHRTLMRLYVLVGRRGAALRQYQQCVEVLRRELGADPEAETQQLYQELLRRPLTAPGTPNSPRVRPHAGLPAPDSGDVRLDLPPPDSPLVGRSDELATLRQAADKASRGEGGIAVLLGEAGIGKSALLSAVTMDGVSSGISILLGRAHESDQILAFGPWVQALRAGKGLLDDTVPITLEPVWQAELARLLPEFDAPGLPPASGSDLRLFEGVAHTIERLADRGPLMLVLEDLHWADEMSLRLLAFVARRLHRWRVLVVATAREEELAESPAARRILEEVGRAGRAIGLSPLSRPDTLRLVRDLAGTGSDVQGLGELEDTVWRVSEGNPLVAVEMTRALQQGALVRGSTALPLPQRVRDLVASRLERVSERGRELAAVAAIIGREFEFTLLQRASGLAEEAAAKGVEELVRRRVIQGVGEDFDFTHDRVRAVVASQLLAPRRKLLHRRVGEAIEAVHAGNVADHIERLAHHALHGELREKAVSYLRQAGSKASARSALAEARGWFEQALSVIDTLPQSPSMLEQGFETRLELRLVLGQLGEVGRALERLREAETLAEKLDDDRRRVRVSAMATNAHLHLGELDKALATGTRALEIARRLEDSSLRILATTSLAQAHLARGEYERVVELATDNLAALAAESDYEPLGTSLPVPIFNRYWLVRSLPQLGRFDEAARYETEALRLAEVTNHSHTVAMTHSAAGWLHLFKGDWAQARRLFEHAISLLRTGSALDLHSTIAASAWVLAQVGEAREALTRLREGEELVERHVARGNLGFVWWPYYYLTRAALLLGRLDEARSLGDHAVKSSLCSPGLAAHALHLLGDIAIHPDRFDAENGQAYYEKALALAEPRGMRPLIAHCHLGLGKLYRRTDKREQAQEHLTTATTMYREMGMTYWLEKAEAEMTSREDRPATSLDQLFDPPPPPRYRRQT